MRLGMADGSDYDYPRDSSYASIQWQSGGGYDSVSDWSGGGAGGGGGAQYSSSGQQ